MNILVLGPVQQKTKSGLRVEPIINFFKNKNFVVFSENKKITLSFIKKNNITLIICSGYAYKIDIKIINFLKNKIFNLHPAILPYGKGIGALLFCIIKDYPLGVTIHLIDKNFDTGKIICQKMIQPKISETFRIYYLRLLDELNMLFISEFDNIININHTKKNQKITRKYDFYTRARSEIVYEFFNVSYDIKIKDIYCFSRGYLENEKFFTKIKSF